MAQRDHYQFVKAPTTALICMKTAAFLLLAVLWPKRLIIKPYIEFEEPDMVGPLVVRLPEHRQSLHCRFCTLPARKVSADCRERAGWISHCVVRGTTHKQIVSEVIAVVIGRPYRY